MKKNYLMIILLFLQTAYSQNTIATILTYNAKRNHNSSLLNNNLIKVSVTNDFVINETKYLENPKKDDIEVIDDMTIVINTNDNKNKINETSLDLKKGNFIEYTFDSSDLNQRYSVTESLPIMKWELISEQKQIGDFLCEKAKTTFRGRTYEVWYTTEIPITYGPWKFNGLPGLMVEIKDTKGIYSWQLVSITPEKIIDFDLETIAKKNSNFKKITYKDYDQEIIEFNVEKSRIKLSRMNTEFKISISFSTENNLEPINEWRTQTQWEISN